jgi:aromatic ring-opening dioxygenase catalytic subunit (LigB family)
MAELVGVFAASHAPLLAREWESFTPAVRASLTAAYDKIGTRLAALRPDVILEIATDHWVNFFLDNLPAVCIGIGAENDGPPEPFMRRVYPYATLPSHEGLARHLAATAFAADFEPALSHRLTLDHGFCIPLWRAGLSPPPPILPILVNEIEPPMLSVRRCLEWGRFLARAIATYPERLTVAILASGGLSHSIGEPTMGAIEEDFDAESIRLFDAGAEPPMIDYFEAMLPRVGNGGHEVRSWFIAHAAAGSRGFELLDYLPVPEVYVGCGFAAWHVAGEDHGNTHR